MEYLIAGIGLSLPDGYADKHFAKALAPFAATAASEADSPIMQLKIEAGECLPQQPEFRALSRFDFPDAACDCLFGHDSAGYLFVMQPGNGTPAAHFRKACNIGNTAVVITDFSSTHNPALFRFGVWMMFNLAAARHSIMAVHSSVIACQGGAILFLGESGTGKSTHTRLWRTHISGATLLNDDSPIVSIRHPKSSDHGNGAQGAAVIAKPDDAAPLAFVCGSPWSGKTPCYKRVELPIRAIVRLSQAPHNHIRQLRPLEAIGALLPSFPPAFAHDQTLQDAVCTTVSAIVSHVPVYHLECLPDRAAAELAYNTVFGTQPTSGAKSTPADSEAASVAAAGTETAVASASTPAPGSDSTPSPAKKYPAAK